MAIIIWLFFTSISLFIMYLVIRAAINHSEISNTSNEVRTIQNQLYKQHQEMLIQLERLNQNITEQNMIIKERMIDTNRN